MSGNYELRLYPDFCLRETAQAVRDVDGEVRDLFDGMTDIMYRYRGVGLAAPQVGVLKRAIVADVGDGLIAIANPEVIEKEDEDRLTEGCLSLPDVHVDVTRSRTIYVQGINQSGEALEQEFTGLAARVIQHEIDHLNGVLIIDYAAPTEKILLRKTLRDLRKRSYR